MRENRSSPFVQPRFVERTRGPVATVIRGDDQEFFGETRKLLEVLMRLNRSARPVFEVGTRLETGEGVHLARLQAAPLKVREVPAL